MIHAHAEVEKNIRNAVGRMTKSPRVSVILTTYNRPRSLYLTLLGYTFQTMKEFEIVIADDGSTEETQEIIAKFTDAHPGIMLQHIWHPDEDFQRTVITNKAASEAKGDYLIISDCDCVPAPDYVEVHFNHREKGTFLNGRRLLMSDEDSAELTDEDVLEKRVFDRDVSSSNKAIAKRHYKSYWYKLIGRKSRLRLMAANLSLYKSDYMKVNGFDERYKGWGTADEDLCRRFFRAGLDWRSVYLKAKVFHIAHPPDPTKPKRVKLGRNIDRYERGFYLTKAFIGVNKRTLSDLNLIIRTAVPSDRMEPVKKAFQTALPQARVCAISIDIPAEKSAELEIIYMEGHGACSFMKNSEEKLLWMADETATKISADLTISPGKVDELTPEKIITQILDLPL